MNHPFETHWGHTYIYSTEASSTFGCCHWKCSVNSSGCRKVCSNSLSCQSLQNSLQACLSVRSNYSTIFFQFTISIVTIHILCPSRQFPNNITTSLNFVFLHHTFSHCRYLCLYITDLASTPYFMFMTSISATLGILWRNPSWHVCFTRQNDTLSLFWHWSTLGIFCFHVWLFTQSSILQLKTKFW